MTNSNTNNSNTNNSNSNSNSNNAQLVKVFNDIFFSFVNLISNTFPNDLDVTIAKNKLYAIKKINPKMIIKIWKNYITDRYRDSIKRGDIDFFIEKNYSEDFNKVSNSDRIMNSVNRLREPIKKMERDKQILTMTYIQDLSKLSEGLISI